MTGRLKIFAMRLNDAKGMNTVMNKIPFVTKEKVEKIVKTYPTPFHIYDEKGIREMRRLYRKLLHGTGDSKNILR